MALPGLPNGIWIFCLPGSPEQPFARYSCFLLEGGQMDKWYMQHPVAPPESRNHHQAYTCQQGQRGESSQAQGRSRG